MNDVLKLTNFMLYAAKHYDNPGCLDITEFNDDMARFKYLKRLFNRYMETGEIKERLVLNHIIILNNVFGVHANTRMLFLKLKGYWPILKPFLVYMNNCPDQILNLETEGSVINTIEIQLDSGIVAKLRDIGKDDEENT